MTAERDKDWVEAFDEAYHNAVVHGTGFIRVTANGPGGLQLSVVDPKDYHYIERPAQVNPLDFVEMVMEKEHLVGRPIVWAEWPNREKKDAV